MIEISNMIDISKSHEIATDDYLMWCSHIICLSHDIISPAWVKPKIMIHRGGGYLSRKYRTHLSIYKRPQYWNKESLFH